MDLHNFSGELLQRAISAALPTAACAALLLLHQISYHRKKGPLPGPLIAIPFVGSAILMITNPTRFWHLQASRANSSGTGLAANCLFGRFMLFVSSTDLSHKVFSNIRPDAFHLIIHPFGKRLFGDRNILYLFGQDHRDLRRRIVPNFASYALNAYVLIQQRVIRQHLNAWFDHIGLELPRPLRLLIRDMNLEVSQTVFVGPYLTADDRDRFNTDFQLFNVGIMSLPIDFPGFVFRRARRTLRWLVGILSRCLTQSRERIRARGAPLYMVEFWMQAGDETPDSVVRGHLYDFLFTAQDASTVGIS